MKLRFSAVLALCAALAGSASAQSNSFSLLNKSGRPIGKASYTVSKSKDGGQSVKSKFEYRSGVPDTTASTNPDRPGNDGSNITDYQMSAEYKLDAAGNFLSGYVSNSATQTMTSFAPTKTRDALEIGTLQAGINGGSRTLPMPKPDFLIAPDYDPGAMQALLNVVLTHPHADHLYLVMVPGVGRSPSQPMYIKAGDLVDATGKLDGKDIKLKKLPLGWNKSQGALYADETGNLMQANVGPINATYVRNKFTLDDAK